MLLKNRESELGPAALGSRGGWGRGRTGSDLRRARCEWHEEHERTGSERGAKLSSAA